MVPLLYMGMAFIVDFSGYPLAHSTCFQINLAHITVYNFFDMMPRALPDSKVELPPTVKRFQERVNCNEKLKKWMEERPNTSF